MSAPEFSREIDARALPAEIVSLAATSEERTALARRLDLIAIDELAAAIGLAPDEEAILATGRLRARVVQSCAVSGEDLPVQIDEDFALRFVPEGANEAEEVELEEDDLDEIAYTGSTIDLGEAIAQTLALAIDPYAAGPQAERVRKAAGLSTPEASGPFAVLAKLRKNGE